MIKGLRQTVWARKVNRDALTSIALPDPMYYPSIYVLIKCYVDLAYCFIYVSHVTIPLQPYG